MGAAFALLLLAAALREGARPRGRGAHAAAAIAASAVALAAALPLLLPARAGPARGALRIVVLDVGQGDAVAVILPDGRTLLFDAGPSSSGRDAGRAVVEPALRAEGARRVDFFVLSHAHLDHFGGLAWLARRGWIAAAVENGSPRLAARRRALRRAVESGGGRWVPLARDTTFAPGAGATLALFAAPRDLGVAPSANSDENDRSIVAVLDAMGRAALLPGDAERAAERFLSPRIRAADALKASHHGSATSSDSVWVAAARPRVALVSCGEGNRFGHPSALTLGRLRLSGARILRTDREGAIRLTADREGLWISTWAHPSPERVAGPVETR